MLLLPEVVCVACACCVRRAACACCVCVRVCVSPCFAASVNPPSRLLRPSVTRPHSAQVHGLADAREAARRQAAWAENELKAELQAELRRQQEAIVRLGGELNDGGGAGRAAEAVGTRLEKREREWSAAEGRMRGELEALQRTLSDSVRPQLAALESAQASLRSGVQQQASRCRVACR